MSDTFDLVTIEKMLGAILTDSFTPIETDELDGPMKQIGDRLNAIHRQKAALVQNYNDDLRSSEARLRNIIESTPVGICITNEDAHFEYVNPTYCRLYGYTSDELIGNHFTMVVPPEHQEELTHLHAEFMGRRYELRGEWSVVRKDGTPLSIIADAAYIIDVDGRPKKVTFVLDISERKHAEELLKETVERLNAEIAQRQELEKTKAQVERMIRHDLRNPLNGVIAAAEILMSDELTDEQRDLCVVIRDSGMKLDSMLSSSMDLTRMEEGTYRLTVQPVNLVSVVKEVTRELGPLSGNREVTVSCLVNGNAVDWGEEVTVEGERLYLADMLVNLIRNAVEASSRGDQVTVSLKTPSEGVTQASSDTDRSAGSEGMVDIDIHNPAVVPPEMREVFFDRYATSGKKDGTGLGTYVAALIVKVHGGTIDFSTDESDGTHLLISIPVRQAERSG